MYQISIREVNRQVRRLWFRLRTRFNASRMTPVEINEMSRSTELFWRDYYNRLSGQPLRFVGVQAVILLSSGARFALPMNVSLRNIEDYFRVAFQYLELMSQGIDVFANGLYIRISGEDLVDPQDIQSGRIDFRIGFDILYPTRNIFQSVEIDQNFVFEDQQSDQMSDQQDLQQEQDSDREREYNQEIQTERYRELERRIDILTNELRDILYNINQNEDVLISLRTARNRWSRNVQQLRRDIENQNLILRRERNRIERQLRGLRRLFNSGEELSSNYDPDTEIYSSSDYSNFQNSPFSVPDSYLDNEDFDDLLDYISGSTSAQNALFDTSPPRTFYSPSSSDISTELYDTRELEELERISRVNELREEISRAEYQLNQLQDLMRDLRNRRINRRSTSYRTLLSGLQNQQREIRTLLQQWQRELRSLQRNID